MVNWSQTLADEVVLLAPHAQRLTGLVQSHDPVATCHLYPGRERESWVLRAYVAPELADDAEFSEALAEASMDILDDFHLDLMVRLLPRDHYAPPESWIDSILAELASSVRGGAS